jgi:uncharacterized membrane protein
VVGGVICGWHVLAYDCCRGLHKEINAVHYDNISETKIVVYIMRRGYGYIVTQRKVDKETNRKICQKFQSYVSVTYLRCIIDPIL